MGWDGLQEEGLLRVSSINAGQWEVKNKQTKRQAYSLKMVDESWGHADRNPPEDVSCIVCGRINLLLNVNVFCPWS